MIIFTQQKTIVDKEDFCFCPDGFPVGIAIAKPAWANQSYAPPSWAGIELRRKAGRMDWSGQAQIKHTTKKL